jgi:hypothetical protein
MVRPPTSTSASSSVEAPVLGEGSVGAGAPPQAAITTDNNARPSERRRMSG